MTVATGGGDSAPTYTVWRCTKCGTHMRTAVPCLEVGHRCPKTKKEETLRGETQHGI